MTRAQANHLVEGERVKTKELAGTVVGATKNCVSIQWDELRRKSSPPTTCGTSAKRDHSGDDGK
jgi:hypothetical protein